MCKWCALNIVECKINTGGRCTGRCAAAGRDACRGLSHVLEREGQTAVLDGRTWQLHEHHQSVSDQQRRVCDAHRHFHLAVRLTSRCLHLHSTLIQIHCLKVF